MSAGAGAPLASLYQEVILRHARTPKGAGRVEHPTGTAERRSPTCGDEIRVEVRLGGETVEDVRFTGSGCAISQASASLMAERLRGVSAAEMDELQRSFRALLAGDLPVEQARTLGELRALAGVRSFPARVRCALLAWDALREAAERTATGEAGDEDGAPERG